MKILITGATGFIGQHLCKSLGKHDFSLSVAVRSPINHHQDIKEIDVGNIGPDTDWSAALDSVDIVIHLAACAHQLGSQSSNNPEQFKQINTEGTQKLASQAASHKIKRFIYMSTVKVYGDSTPNNVVLTESSKVGSGCDEYGLSKLNAERELIKISENSEMEFVIIRSPLVYGPGVGANFRSLIQLLETGIPVPFKAIKNQRSMVAIDNLINFIHCCIENKAASNQIFQVSDNDDIKLPRLIRLIRSAMGSSVRLFTLPFWLIKLMATIVGKSVELGKLTDSIQLDISKATTLLNWKPVISVDDAITKTMKDYLEQKEC